VLNKFSKSYLPRVKVRFVEGSIETASGQSDLERGIIYLASRQKLNADSIGLGLTYAYRIGPKYRKMKLSRNELYFLTLLHEIGHFRIKEKIPKSYLRLRKQIVREDSAGKRRVELSFIESKLKRWSGESESAWKLRLADFMSWLATGESISHHMKVENWAIDEFERKRKFIGGLLLDARLAQN
jgi:hypothetical protein